MTHIIIFHYEIMEKGGVPYLKNNSFKLIKCGPPEGIWKLEAMTYLHGGNEVSPDSCRSTLQSQPLSLSRSLLSLSAALSFFLPHPSC